MKIKDQCAFINMEAMEIDNTTSVFSERFQDLFDSTMNKTAFSSGVMPNLPQLTNLDNEDHILSLLAAARNNTSVNSTKFDFDEMMKGLADWGFRLNMFQSCQHSHYCSGEFREVIAAYNSIHGYVSLLVCLFGTLANVLNVAVLTRRDMAAAPINRLLKWLAVTDVFVMLEYVPFAIYKYLVLPGHMDFPYSWAAYLLFHLHFAQILHTASICLTLSLAVWRYIAIKYPEKSHVLCTERRCSLAILTSFVLPPVLCIPTYMVFKIHTTVVTENATTSILYHLDSDLDGRLFQINFWVHSVLIKLLPCLILTLISFWLIRALYSANRRKQALRGYNACPTGNQIPGTVQPPPKSEVALKRQSKNDRRTDRTTKMLLAVLLLFLITEFPQGILGLMSGILGKCFFKRCYDLFGDLMDILALLNGAINFILYCSMSRQFRMTFGQLFKPNILAKWPGGSQTEIQSTTKSSVP